MSAHPVKKAYLSKSKLLSHLQCPRRLYLEVNHPDLSEVSEATEAVMATGSEVGEVARTLHAGGVLIEKQENLGEAIRLTGELIAAKPRKTLFEATFAHDDVLVRADILEPQRKVWWLTEVKSSTEVKDYHVQDAAIQAHVLAEQGLPLGRVSIQHINNAFVYPGKGCYHQVKRNGTVNSLFTEVDVTAEIKPMVKNEVPKWIAAARKTLAGDMPARTENCDEPYVCPFKDYCYPQTADYPTECLPRIGKAKARTLLAAGYQDIRDIPQGDLTNDTHERIRQVTVSGKAELRIGAAKILAKLGWPRYYLDFETIMFAVPIWKGTRPYQQLPFQWSCHVERKDGSLQHAEFLDLSGEDPMRACAESLIAALGKRGPVFVYYQSFEAGRVRELAARYRDLAPALQAIEKRFVDLLPMTRENYYHPDMLGSWSIKNVLPTIAPELDYADLEHVQDGGGAQAAYLEVIGSDTTPERKANLERALRIYCQRDTEAMVRLASFLRSAK